MNFANIYQHAKIFGLNITDFHSEEQVKFFKVNYTPVGECSIDFMTYGLQSELESLCRYIKHE